ncbi:hypothetical protein PC110_g6600 [Phytophthora cactorum]|nr:hypothetical protein PC110_g6600 [Phytophthora cactorum]
MPVDAGDVFILRFVRVKMSEEPGLSLLPDAEFATCPLLSIWLAFCSPSCPTPRSRQQSPRTSRLHEHHIPPLTEFPNAPQATTGHAAPAAPPHVDTTPTVYAHVNRVLDRVTSVS